MSEPHADPDQLKRKTVRVDLDTMGVYPSAGRGDANRIGTVLSHTTREGARTPTGGAFTSRRLTVHLIGDGREWVGQISNEEYNKKSNRKTVILRPLPLTVKEEIDAR